MSTTAHDPALDFIRHNGRGVLATLRRDGTPQLSPVVAGVDAESRVVISTREPSVKVRNLRRAPHATLCVFTDTFFGEWRSVDGPVEIVTLPDAMEPLVEYYRARVGEHPDWDEYRAAMERERRVLLRMTVERSGPTVTGWWRKGDRTPFGQPPLAGESAAAGDPPSPTVCRVGPTGTRPLCSLPGSTYHG